MIAANPLKTERETLQTSQAMRSWRPGIGNAVPCSAKERGRHDWGRLPPRLSTATLKHLNCRARFSVVSGLFCSSQNLACRPTQKNGKVVSLFRIKVPACLDRRRTAAVGCVRAGNGHLPLQVAVGPESLGTAPSWFSNPQGYSGNAEASKDRNVYHVQNRAESNRSGKLTGDDRHRQWRHFNSEVCKRCIENHQG